MNIPTGFDHIEMLEALAVKTRQESIAVEMEQPTELKMIGTSLSALYQAATCHQKCHGGPHILEALSGRTYNLGVSAYILITRGFYDEALNLVRSLGEISNLITLSVVDKAGIREWLSSDKKTRMKKFSPAQVRRALERQGRHLMLADGDWYSRFCETYTHVTPETKPNVHNDAGLPYVGGVYQEDGLRNSLGELATALGVIALMVSKYVGLEELFDELSSIVDTAER
ncbi:MAG TPA: hypothetical protein VF668_06570 [Pyrinomonadaceae bacterium]|jgi:hypothetical protein